MALEELQKWFGPDEEREAVSDRRGDIRKASID